MNRDIQAFHANIRALFNASIPSHTDKIHVYSVPEKIIRDFASVASRADVSTDTGTRAATTPTPTPPTVTTP